jgi:TetR/AcrR family transcriptional regulator, transcriptional repressor for nem operon
MQDTREQIISLAEQLIKTRGFNAFSYKDISDPLAIKNAAVHYHFPSKTDLGAAVLDKELERMANLKTMMEGMTEMEQLEAVVSTFDRKRQTGCICLMGSLSPDFDTLPPVMQEKLQAVSDAILEVLTETLKKGRTKKVFKFKGEPADRALMVVSTLLSSLLLARVNGNDVYIRMREQLLADLKGA